MKNMLQTSRLAVVYHPGTTLDEKLKEIGMGVKEFAVRTGKPEKTVIAVINGESSITPDMAVSFESVTRIPADFWMNSQRMFNEYVVRVKRETDAAGSAEWMRKFPVAEMLNRGWIQQAPSVEQKVLALYDFFGVSSEKAWKDYYIRQELKVVFSISLANARNPYSLSAWLRKGEIEASSVEVCGSYSAKALKSVLSEMKRVMATASDDCYAKLAEICSSAGIKLVNVKCLPGMHVDGAARWIRGVPVIQLSDSFLSYDKFCYTFLHELGHVLLHGKKDVFLEGGIGVEMEAEKECEADFFASDFLLSKSDEREIVGTGDFSADAIVEASRKYMVHPSVVAERLKCLKLIGRQQCAEFNIKVKL